MDQDREEQLVARTRRSGLVERPARRVGWSAEEAAEVLQMPAKTIRTWATVGLVGPTAPADAAEVDRWGVMADTDEYPRVYSLSDLVRVRVVRDLLEESVDRDVVRAIARELAAAEPWGAPDARRIAASSSWTNWFLLLEEAAAEARRANPDGSGHVIPYDDVAAVDELLEDLDWDRSGRWPANVYEDEEGREVWGILYPQAEVTRELVKGADEWLEARGLPTGGEASPWM